jgi:uncharacterized protein YheU (UPF0270 family)
MEIFVGIVLGGILSGVVYGLAQIFFEGFLRRALDKPRQWITRVASTEPRTPELVGCSIRSVDGTTHGFGTTWATGEASLAPHRITFAADGTETAIPVTSIGPVAADTSRGMIRTVTLRLRTDEGVLECSLQRRSVDRLRAIVEARG